MNGIVKDTKDTKVAAATSTVTDTTKFLHHENVGYYHSARYNSIQRLNKINKMHGVKRVITFCVLIVILPASLIIIPLYLRHSVFADVIYAVAESDILEIRDGVSSVFCQEHSLRMNTSFNAFQMRGRPEISTNRKHIRLKKSMTLPDDTLEYWGFYLLKGAIVELKVCSRYDGSRILVVKGDRNLHTCGLLEHNKNKVGANFAEGHEKVQVTFETAAEVIIESKNEKGRSQEIYETISSAVDTRNGLNNDLQLEDAESVNHGGEDFSESKVSKKTIAAKTNANSLSINSDKYNANNDDNNNKYFHKNNTNNEFAIIDNKTEQTLSSTLGTTIETDKSRTTLNADKEAYERIDYQKLRHRRHHNRKFKSNHVHKNQRIHSGLYRDKDTLGANLLNRHDHKRIKRQKQFDHIYDRKISHGGNAFNFSDDNSISSFENNLLTCYDGKILLAQGFPPSSQCSNVSFLESGTHMVSKHEVVADGYYYYIFYSDNDLVRNDIHAVFDIFKPTFQYSNISESQGCVNSTNCSFPVKFLSDEVVIVEVPTRDGIEHEEDDVTYLISTCHPRMAIYIIFPISVLFLILSCAFL